MKEPECLPGEKSPNVSFAPGSRTAHFPWLQCNTEHSRAEFIVACEELRPMSSWAQLDSRAPAVGTRDTWQKGFMHSKAAEQ